jgi:hypothetical protein
MDKVRIKGHELSSKPPVLSAIGASIYWVLHTALGLNFGKNEAVLVWLLVALLCTMPLLVLLWLFHGLVRREGLAAAPALGVTALLGCGTLCFPYGTILANHIPAAAALFVCARELRSHRRDSSRYACAAGFLGCLAVTFELTAVFPVLAITAYLLWSRREWPYLGMILAGAAGPAIVHLALTWISTGSVLPVQLRPELWHYEGSYWNHPQSWDALNQPKWLYGLLCFFGGRGLFTMTPVLLLALPALWRGLRRGAGVAWPTDAPGRAEAVTVLTGFVGLATFIILRTNNYGGGHYGMRWFLLMVPLLLVITAPLLAGMHSRLGLVGVALLVLPGLYTAQIYWFGKPTVYELLLMRWGLLQLPP